jgi:hypothetical protein
MSPRDWTLPPCYPLCVFSDSYYRTGQAIFSSLNGATSEMFAAAQESLERYRTELEQKMPPMHYGLSVGTHRCVADLHREATARLRSLSVLQPAPPAAPPPDAGNHNAALMRSSMTLRAWRMT